MPASILLLVKLHPKQNGAQVLPGASGRSASVLPVNLPLESWWVDWPLDLAEAPPASTLVAVAETGQGGCCVTTGPQACGHRKGVWVLRDQTSLQISHCVILAKTLSTHEQVFCLTMVVSTAAPQLAARPSFHLGRMGTRGV